LFNEINRKLENKKFKLKVVFGALSYPRRKWDVDMSDCKFEYEVLSSKNIKYDDPEKASFTYSGLYRVISKEKPVVIITNAFSIATMKLWLRSWFKRTPYLIWSGAIHRKDQPESFLRKLQRRILIDRASAFIAYGTKAKEYLISFGANPDKIEIGINTVDTEYYKKETEEIRKILENKKIENYENKNYNKKHLLYIGHLSQRKNVLKIIEAINNLSKTRKDIILDIVGDGDEQMRLEKYVMENNLTEFVEFHGFKQKKEIPQYMAKADCFLFQTDFDIWGLVLVEAMAAGLTCIASTHAGATYDLIKEGVTGFAMDFSETEKVAKKIDWILKNPESAKEIGQKASRFIGENVTIEKSAEGFVKAILTAMQI
jgi:glycosyltransferase involved in cell wall biosynthesis